MLDELERRNYAKTTVQYYLKAVERFATHFHRPPDQLNHAHLREYQAYLLRDRKLGPRTVKLHVSALRFFFVKSPTQCDLARHAARLLAVDEAEDAAVSGHGRRLARRQTEIYLHLSRRHLHAVANPLDTMAVSTLDTARRSRRLQKR